MPDQVKPLLAHPDRFVRHAAADYFTESYSRDPDVLPLIIDAYRTHRTFEDRLALPQGGQLALSERGVESVLSCLGQELDATVIDKLNSVLEVMSADLARQLMASLRGRDNVRPETVARLERRVRLAGRPGEDLWRELRDVGERARTDEEYADALDLDYVTDLIDALAPHAVPDDETLCRLLRELPEEEGWLEGFLVDLSGARRVRAAVPALVDKYRIDADFPREQVTPALACIGDVEAVRLVQAMFLDVEWHVRLYAANVFDAIRAEEAERAALELVDRVEEDDIRASLCGSLLKMFSAPGLPVVLKVIEEEKYDRRMVHLDTDAVTAADALGVTLPRADEWRKRREQENKRFERALAEAPDWLEGAAEGEAPPRRAVMEQAPADSYSRQVPFQHSEQRVGRNDPCPCGSGKKFKKCCGRS
jgi:hypothetical protein